MVVVFGLAGGLWFLGRVFDAPVNARLLMIALLYVAVLAANIALPEGAPLREALGGSAAVWLVLGGIGVAIWAYAQGLVVLRSRVRPENRPKDGQASTEDARLDRAARHIALREIGGMGQRRIEQARVLVVGAGGIGAPALQYLASTGVGTIGVIDNDVVEVSNLQRQTIHIDARLGMPKVFSAEAAIHEQNPFVKVRPYNRRLTAEIAKDLIDDYDVVLDGSDDVDTRYAVNAAAVAAKVPLISGAISQWEGQVSLFDPSRGYPCYSCVFPKPAAPDLSATCAEAGVVSALPGVIGTIMALEAIKFIAGAGEGLGGRMMIFDGLTAESRTIAIKRDPNCNVCGRHQS